MKELTTMSNELLLADLDDIVQRLSNQDNIEWAQNHSQDKKDFESLKNEIYNRLLRKK